MADALSGDAAIVVVRDPDSSNDIRLYGFDVPVYDVDLGRMDLDDPGECVEWASSWYELHRTMTGPARDDIVAIVDEQLAQLRFTARFTPQQWDGDYCNEVNVDRDKEWDVTALFFEATDDQRQAWLAEMAEHGEALDGDDWFHQTPGQPEWAHHWPGPFDIHIRRPPWLTPTP